MPRPQKRSVTLKGHRTSITLEEEFWLTLRGIAEEQGKSLNELISEIDASRISGENMDDIGLSSAIRVFVVKDLKKKLGDLAQRREVP
ncbi:MAG: aryl-sulfate sulfotransferase [Alphaproteobacteria bacterium]|nr:MAG: aryl-sulfate sulfotransferase [Alphaproteobacteria bacterium]